MSHSASQADSNEPVCLLALDGGGIRGVSELLILHEIMRRVQHDLKLPELPRPCDYFDLIGGTSTGGLIALMLGRLRMSTDEALQAYNSLARDIFSKKNRKWTGQDGAFKSSTLQEKVNELVLKKGLGEFMLDPLDEPKKKGKAFVCAMPADNVTYTRRFRTYQVRALASANCKIWEAARATTAAPTFFKRIAIGEEGHGKEEFMDGALGCNNPAIEVLEEARSVFGDKKAIRCLVSIGTGQPGAIGLSKPDTFQKLLPTSLIQVLKKIATNCESTSNVLRARFENIDAFYFRFNVVHGAQGISLEEWEKMEELTTHTKAYMKAESQSIDKIVAVLCDRKNIGLTLGIACGVPRIEGEKEIRDENKPKGHWVVPFPRNPRFVDRVSQLDLLESKVFAKEQRQKIAITGLGGMGKTQIALELAFRIRNKYEGCSVFWIPATSPENIQQALVNIGRELGILDGSSQNDVRKLMQSHLSQESTGQWLLIIDNIDDVELWDNELKKFLPVSPRGSIVCTTRTRRVAVKIATNNVINVSQMGKEMAMQLLRKSLIQEDLLTGSSDAMELLDQLTFLPLAIVQAAAYINANEITLSDYLSLLQNQEQDAVELLNEDFDDDWRYKDIKNPVTTTWLISFEHILQHYPLAADYLAFMSCILPKDIPLSILIPGPSRKQEMEAIGTLTAYSFVSKRSADEALDIHRLVQLATRNWLKMKNEWSFWTQKAFERLNEILPYDDIKKWRVWSDYLPHAIHVAELPGYEEEGNRLKLLVRIACCEKELGRYSTAEWAQRKLLSINQSKHGPEDEWTLESTSMLAAILRLQGNYTESEILFRRVMEGREKVLGLDDPSTLISVGNLGALLVQQGRYTEGEAMHRRAIEGKVKVLGPDHLSTLISIVNLGGSLVQQGRYTEGEAMHRRAIEGKVKVLGPDHLSTLISINNLGGLLVQQGKYTEGEAMHRRAIEGKVKVLGPDHLSTLISIDHLAMALRGQGKYTKAEEARRRAIRGKEKLLGPEHLETVTNASVLGSVLIQQRKYKEAQEVSRGGAGGREKVLELEHLDTLMSRNYLAVAYAGAGRLDEAEALLKEVLQIRTIKSALGYPLMLLSMGNVATVYWNRGRLYEAEPMEAVLKHRVNLEAINRGSVSCMEILACSSKEMGNVRKTIPLKEGCYDRRVAVLGSEHSYTIDNGKWLAQWRLDLENKTKNHKNLEG